jgi:hypothetical protein
MKKDEVLVSAPELSKTVWQRCLEVFTFYQEKPTGTSLRRNFKRYKLHPHAGKAAHNAFHHSKDEMYRKGIKIYVQCLRRLFDSAKLMSESAHGRACCRAYTNSNRP